MRDERCWFVIRWTDRLQNSKKTIWRLLCKSVSRLPRVSTLISYQVGRWTASFPQDYYPVSVTKWQRRNRFRHRLFLVSYKLSLSRGVDSEMSWLSVSAWSGQCLSVAAFGLLAADSSFNYICQSLNRQWLLLNTDSTCRKLMTSILASSNFSCELQCYRWSRCFAPQQVSIAIEDSSKASRTWWAHLGP